MGSLDKDFYPESAEYDDVNVVPFSLDDSPYILAADVTPDDSAYFKQRLNVINIALRLPELAHGRFHPAIVNLKPVEICRTDTSTPARDIKVNNRAFLEAIMDAIFSRGEASVEICDATMYAFLSVMSKSGDFLSMAKRYFCNEVVTYALKQYGARVCVESFDLIMPKDLSPYSKCSFKIVYSLGEISKDLPVDKNALDFVGNNLLN